MPKSSVAGLSAAKGAACALALLRTRPNYPPHARRRARSARPHGPRTGADASCASAPALKLIKWPAAFRRPLFRLFRNTLPSLIDDFSTLDRLPLGTFTPFGPGIGVKATFDGCSGGHAFIVRGQDLTGGTLPRWSM